MILCATSRHGFAPLCATPAPPEGHVSPLEPIRRTNAAGSEFRSSREFAEVLGDADDRNVGHVVQKARTACLNSAHRIEDHFVDITEMAQIGRVLDELEVRELRRSRQFYLAYPQIRDSLTPNSPREHRAVEHLRQLVRPQRPRGSRQPALEAIGAIHYRDIVRSLSAQSDRPLIEGAASDRDRGGTKEAGAMKRQNDVNARANVIAADMAQDLEELEAMLG